jgi:hypothetical protein
VYTFSSQVSTWSWYAQYSYVILTEIAFLETSGRALEEVDEIFVNTTSIFSAVRAAKDLPRTHVVRHGVAIVEKEEQSTNENREVLEVSVGNGHWTMIKSLIYAID